MNDIEEFSKLHDISQSDVIYMSRRSPLRCPCGSFRTVKKSSQSLVGMQLGAWCLADKCNPAYGKARPEHSVKMKALAADPASAINRVLKKKGYVNPFFNSQDFKRRAVENAGIPSSSKTIDEAFAEYCSARMKSPIYRAKMVARRVGKWPQWAVDFLEAYFPAQSFTFPALVNSANLDDVFAKSHGIQTVLNAKNTGRNSWFKSELVDGLALNREGLTAVMTRSGWESTAIRLFETSGVKWSYETLRLRTPGGIYTPDFIIEVGGETWLIEIKGSFYRTDKEACMRERISTAVQYAKSNGWKFSLVLQEPTTLQRIFEGEIKWA